MSTSDLFVMFGPLLAFVTLMAIAFGVYHYLENRNG